MAILLYSEKVVIIRCKEYDVREAEALTSGHVRTSGHPSKELEQLSARRLKRPRSWAADTVPRL